MGKKNKREQRERQEQKQESFFSKYSARTKNNKESLTRFEPRTEGQFEYVRLIENHSITLAIGPAGSGKAQPLDSKILTPSGWKLMGDIKVNDLVSTPKGGISKVVAVFPQGKKDIYKVTFHDGASTRCCEEHLWTCYVRKYWEGSKKCTISTSNIKEKLNKGMVVSIPLTQSQGSTAETDLPLDPYMLGVLIGDGCLVHNVLFTTSDDFILGEIQKVLKTGYSINKVKLSKYDYRIVNNNENVHVIVEGQKYTNYYTRELDRLGLIGCKAERKFIPDLYKRVSISQKWALVQGLMDTDGTVGKKHNRKGGDISFTTVSKRLANDLQEMLWSLGATCTITSRVPTFRYKGIKKLGQRAYTLHVGYAYPKQIFRLPRKQDRCLNKFSDGRVQLQRRVKSIEFVASEEAQCILIDDPEHLYITDDYIVTHNTFLSVWMAVKALTEGKYNKIVLTRPAIEAAGEKLGALPGDEREKIFPYLRPLYDSLEKILGRSEVTRLVEIGIIEILPLAYMRGLSLENAFIIMDEGQNASVEQFKMLLTRLGKHSKLVATGDLEQSDVERKNTRSGLEDAVLRFSGEEEIAIAQLGMADIQRHPLVAKIIKAYKNNLPPDANYQKIYYNK